VSIVTVGIADAQTICREGVRSLLEHQEGFEVVGEAADGMEAAALAKQFRPDVLLLELSMPRYSGLAALKELKSSALPTRSLLLLGDLCREELYEALELGASGWIQKSAQSALLFQGIRAVASGEYWIGREDIGPLVQALRRKTGAENGSNAGRYGLTPRELSIIGKIVGGYSNREIAKELAVSERTIKHHLTHIFDKVGSSSRLELAIFAVNHHLAD
jgi:two-component system, NarL family, nitrate/nitrite response regulator NarL